MVLAHFSGKEKMINVNDHAIMLLRYMLEKGLVATKSISRRELQVAVGISPNDFDSADKYLLQAGFIEGGGGRTRWNQVASYPRYSVY